LTCQDVVDKSVWPGHCRTCLRQIRSMQCDYSLSTSLQHPTNCSAAFCHV